MEEQNEDSINLETSVTYISIPVKGNLINRDTSITFPEKAESASSSASTLKSPKTESLSTSITPLTLTVPIQKIKTVTTVNTNTKVIKSKSKPLNIAKKIDKDSFYFPFCILWRPIPIISSLVPLIGHTGVCTSRGIIHDFVGSFFVGVDDFTFGDPIVYVELSLNENQKKNWDRAIEKGDNKFNMEEHNLFINNCYSHVAYVLNQINYKGRNNYNMFNIWWMVIKEGKFVSIKAFLKKYLLFFLLIVIFVIYKINK